MHRLLTILVSFILLAASYGGVFQPLEKYLGSTSVKVAGDELVVSSRSATSRTVPHGAVSNGWNLTLQKDIC